MQNNARTAVDMVETRAHSEWFACACLNGACPSDGWVVQRVPGFDDLWRVAQHPGDAPALVAATDPCCPRCGCSLAIALELPPQPQPNESLVFRWARR